jgi:hypothetical protein
LPDKETILQQTGVDEYLRSSKMVIMAPSDEESSEFKRISEIVDREVTPGAVIEIDPVKAMKKSSRVPLAWVVTQLVIFLSKYFKSSYDTRLSIGGTIQKPSPDAVPKDFPGDSSEVDRWIAWQEWFRGHCLQYCPQAWQAWLSSKVVYSIFPTAEELALLMSGSKTI